MVLSFAFLSKAQLKSSFPVAVIFSINLFSRVKSGS